MTSVAGAPTWAKSARDLYVVAMAVFLVTIVRRLEEQRSRPRSILQMLRG